MSQQTQQMLEENLNNTLALIDDLNDQIEAKIIEKQGHEADLVTAQQQIAQIPFWNETSGQGKMILDEIRGRITRATNELEDLQTRLRAAQNQRDIDQNALRDYKLSNLSPDELGAYLEAEQKAVESARWFGLKRGVVIAIIVLIFLVIGFIIWRRLRRKKG